MPWPHGGSGTEESPYLVNTADALDDMRDYGGANVYFKTTAEEIDLEDYQAGEGWVPITMTFAEWDGNGVFLSGLKIDRAVPRQGLFNEYTGDVKDVRVMDADVSGSRFQGIFAWRPLTGSNAAGIYISGSISGQDSGGIFDNDQSDNLYSECGSMASVDGANGRAGGVARQLFGRCENCFGYGPVTSTVTHNWNAAGFYNLSGSGTPSPEVTTSIASCPVTQSSGTPAAFGGDNNATRVQNYYNSDQTDTDNSYVAGKTYDELKNINTYGDQWDFDDVWFFATLQNLQALWGNDPGQEAYDRLPAYVRDLPWLRRLQDVLIYGITPEPEPDPTRKNRPLFFFAGL